MKEMLQMALDALEPDAARYRWLRDWATSSDWEYIGWQTNTDAAIAKMAERKGEA